MSRLIDLNNSNSSRLVSEGAQPSHKIVIGVACICLVIIGLMIWAWH